MASAFWQNLASFTADECLSPYIYVFYVAFLISLIFTPIMGTVARYYGIIDEPDGQRKMHSKPVAYLGGVAVFLGWIAGLAISQFILVPKHNGEFGLSPTLLVRFSIPLGACVIVILGLWDDIRHIRPRYKILGQAVAAVFLLLDKVGTHTLAPIFTPISLRLTEWYGLPAIPEWLTVTASSVFVIMVVVGCCNASNLLDGLDGLCGGVTAIIAGGFLFLAVHQAMVGGGLNANLDGMRIVIALALLGAVLGFVPYNFNPASIFMGDTGSMFLGFSCSVMIILMAQGQHPKWFLASMVMFALPVLDTGLAFARRWVNGRRFFEPDRFHFHHQLVARGFTVKQTVVISYGLAMFFALMGALIAIVRTRYAVAFYLVTFGSLVVAAFKMGMVHERPVVVTRKQINSRSATLPNIADIESATVMEVRDEPREVPVLAEPAGTGIWNHGQES
ncbi:MAG TPA: MraY family glycosyltransferase [Tepidisphaeraceae bacterium]|jgi:UDP-GlcNAc:undecaprenyl-phosphate GlcNAc-1-phosphate transferase